jgi:hypothetical protein
MGTLATRKNRWLTSICHLQQALHQFKGIHSSNNSSSGVCNKKEMQLLQLQHD